jgi:carnitine 3-dehydrogenase
VSLETRRPSEPGPELLRKIGAIAAGHAGLPRPDGLGRYVGAPR